MNWIWVATFTVLGSTPEHVTFGAYETRSQCIEALEQRRREYLQRNKEIAGTCYYTTKTSK